MPTQRADVKDSRVGETLVLAGTAAVPSSLVPSRTGYETATQGPRLRPAAAPCCRHYRQSDERLEMNLVYLLDQHARSRPRAPAVIGDEGAIDYETLVRQTSSFARGLLGRGVREADRIVLLLRNRPSFLVAFLGAVRAGVVPVPVNPSVTGSELVAVADDLEATVVIASPSAPTWGADGLTFLSLDSVLDPVASDAPLLTAVPRRSQDLANVMFTAGTSGRPKGVMQSHGMHLALGAGMADAFGFTATDVIMLLSPLFHIGGFTFLSSSLFAGCPVVLEPTWERDRVLASMDRHGVTAMHMITTVLLDIVREEREEPSGVTCDALRYVFTGGGTATPEHIRSFEQRFDCFVSEGYGRTEGGKAWNRPGDPRREGAHGRPLEAIARMRITDEATGHEVAEGVPGRIVVKGDGLASGYWKRPDLNASLFDESGWMDTGDMGKLDDAGLLYFLGRKDGVIKTGGENVAPAEVEKALLSIAGVLDAFVTGQPHERYGECVAAVVVTGGVDAAAIRAACRSLLSGYKVPKRILVVDEIPRLESHKVDRTKVRAMLRDTVDL